MKFIACTIVLKKKKKKEELSRVRIENKVKLFLNTSQAKAT